MDSIDCDIEDDWDSLWVASVTNDENCGENEMGSCDNYNLGFSYWGLVGKSTSLPPDEGVTCVGYALNGRGAMDSVKFQFHTFSHTFPGFGGNVDICANMMFSGAAPTINEDSLRFYLGHCISTYAGCSDDSSSSWDCRSTDFGDSCFEDWAIANPLLDTTSEMHKYIASDTVELTADDTWFTLDITRIHNNAVDSGFSEVFFVLHDQSQVHTSDCANKNTWKFYTAAYYCADSSDFRLNMKAIFYSEDEVTTTGRRARMLKGN